MFFKVVFNPGCLDELEHLVCLCCAGHCINKIFLLTFLLLYIWASSNVGLLSLARCMGIVERSNPNITINPTQSVTSCQDFVFRATAWCCRSLLGNSKYKFSGPHKIPHCWNSSWPEVHSFVFPLSLFFFFNSAPIMPNGGFWSTEDE